MFNSSLPDKLLLRTLFKGLNVYFNYTGTTKCLDYAATGAATQSLGDLGWDYQVSHNSLEKINYNWAATIRLSPSGTLIYLSFSGLH